MNQLVKLYKGDVLTLKNHSSLLNPVTLPENAGGSLVTNNAVLVLYRLASLPKKCEKPCEKPCKKEVKKEVKKQ